MSISIERINLTVGDEVYLKDISLEFESGSKNILLGRTLAGKTSLLRILAGLDRPSSGRILVDGRDVTGVSVRKRNISMVYQQFINYPSFTVYDNIASPLKVAGMEKSRIDARVREVAGMLHLETMLDRLPIELSGGQQQRCAIARALVKDVNLLLLDEPLVNLDYKLREELQIDLQEIFKQKNAIVVYTTTEPGEALKLGGRIVVLDEGRVLQTGPSTQVYHQPASVKVAEVFSDPPINLIACRVENASFFLGRDLSFPQTGNLSTLAPGDYIAGIRANHLYLKAQAGTDISMDTIVRLSEINGSETFFHVNSAGTDLVVQEVGVYSRKIGSGLKIFLAPENLFIFSKTGELILSPKTTRAETALES